MLVLQFSKIEVQSKASTASVNLKETMLQAKTFNGMNCSSLRTSAPYSHKHLVSTSLEHFLAHHLRQQSLSQPPKHALKFSFPRSNIPRSPAAQENGPKQSAFGRLIFHQRRCRNNGSKYSHHNVEIAALQLVAKDRAGRGLAREPVREEQDAAAEQ